MLRGRKMMKNSRAAIAFWVFYLASEMVGFSRGDGPYAEKQGCGPCNEWMDLSSVQGDHHYLPSLLQKSCTYTIMVETTCTQSAGTSDHISLRFGDSNSSDILVHHLNTKHVRRVDGEHTTVLDDVPRRPFRACNVDQFHVTGPCMESPVCYLFLKQKGKDGWRPGMVQVLVPGTSPYSSHTFYFRRYLPWNVWHGTDSCATKVTPFGIKHTRKMFGDKNKLVTKVLF